jgi:glycosyltransferase involved in cell wall biosynthesis
MLGGMPALSVLVPVRDARPWLRASFASLARQRFADFEIVAVDDGSTDGSSEWLDRHARSESRLRVVHTGARGLPAALATALEAARAPWIARHDADDLSHRDRFARQLAHLERNPSVDVLGTRVRLFPTASVGAGMRRWARWNGALLDHAAMRDDSLIDSVLIHGTMMARRPALVTAGGWLERGWPEDVDLWRRLFESGARLSKLPESLYAWRQHPASATRNDPRYRRPAFDALRRDAIERRGDWRGRALTLVAVGRALERWRELLAHRPGALKCHDAGHPSPARVSALVPPIVLVFGATPARIRWREALRSRGWCEWDDFIFVA